MTRTRMAFTVTRSFPRKRESRAACRKASGFGPWVPAFAGTNGLGAPAERSRPPLDLGGERHAAGPAAGARRGNHDFLLLLLVEVGAVEHGPDLLLEQVMQREI